MARVNEAMGEEGPRTAHFICALSVAWPDGHTETVEGRVDGRLVWPPRGDNGFGYDPMFLMDGQSLTYGEMARRQKEADNHRARAFRQLAAVLPPRA
jgi:XTP/dITP diphosphohydrolase